MTVNASTFNTPLEALLDRTAWLKTRVDGLVPDVQTFTADGTWTKPANAVLVHVQAIGAGGAGGGAVSSGSPAGGGGGSAPLVQRFYLPDLLAATEGVQVGQGGGMTAANTSGAQGQASIFATGKDYRLHAIGGNGGIGGHLGSAGGNGFCGGGGGGNNAPGGNGATVVQDAAAGSGTGGAGGESVSLFLRGGVSVFAGSAGAGGDTTEGGRGGHGYGAGGGGGGAANGGGGGGGMGWVIDGSSPTAGDGTGTADSPARNGGPGAPGIVIVTTWRAVVA